MKNKRELLYHSDKNINQLIEMAEDEIKEWKQFLKELKELKKEKEK